MERVRAITLQRECAAGKAVKLVGRALAFAENCKTSEVLLAHFVLPVFAAKSAAAMARGKNGFETFVPGFGRGKPHKEGYRVVLSRLPKYNSAQVLLVANEPKLLLGELEDSLWRYLMSEAITTPLLRDWLPELQAVLTRNNKIHATNSFGYPVHLAGFETSDVDRFVSHLIRGKKVSV